MRFFVRLRSTVEDPATQPDRQRGRKCHAAALPLSKVGDHAQGAGFEPRNAGPEAKAAARAVSGDLGLVGSVRCQVLPRLSRTCFAFHASIGWFRMRSWTARSW